MTHDRLRSNGPLAAGHIQDCAVDVAGGGSTQKRHRVSDLVGGRERNSQDLWIGVSRDLLITS
jgi:hypothetical protein